MCNNSVALHRGVVTAVQCHQNIRAVVHTGNSPYDADDKCFHFTNRLTLFDACLPPDWLNAYTL